MTIADNSESPSSLRSRHRSLVATALLIVSVIALFFTATRIVRTHQTPGPFNLAAQGFCDFQNGVYFPSKAFINRVSPYSQQYAAEYPVPRSTPFYSPVVFAAHAVFAMLPLQMAEVVYFVWLVMLTAAIAWFTAVWLKPWTNDVMRLDLAALTFLLLIVSRGGQQTLYTGYFTFEIILACLIAIQYAHRRPWLAGIALVIVSFKPNFVLPLGLLLLCRGNIKAILIGGVISLILAIVCFEWIKPAGGYSELVEQIRQTQEVHHADPIEKPVNTWLRVDTLAVVAKWSHWEPSDLVSLLAMLAFVIPVGVVIARQKGRFSERDGVMNWAGGLILLTMTVAIYHHVFDAIVLIPWSVWGLLKAKECLSKLRRKECMAVVVASFLCLVPQGNYLSSQKFLTRYGVTDTLFLIITSVNGIALLAAFFLLVCSLGRSDVDQEKCETKT